MIVDVIASSIDRSPRRGAAIIGLLADLLMPSVAVARDHAIASATSADGKARIDILSLKRTEGETVTLRMMITNNGNDGFDPILGNARLIDMIGRRIYSPGLTSPTCITRAGQKQGCYATFGAPPAGTPKLNIQFYEKLDLITGVPISE